MVMYGVGGSDEQADADYDRNLERFLQRCREKGIKLNKLKLKLKCTEFSYLGHLVTNLRPETRPGQDKGCARKAETGQHQSSQTIL